MTRKEFETRTNVQVSDSFFNTIINPLYMISEGDKDEFCKEFNKKKTWWLQRALNWEHENWRKERESNFQKWENQITLEKQREELYSQIAELQQQVGRYKAALQAIKMSMPNEI